MLSGSQIDFLSCSRSAGADLLLAHSQKALGNCAGVILHIALHMPCLNDILCKAPKDSRPTLYFRSMNECRPIAQFHHCASGRPQTNNRSGFRIGQVAAMSTQPGADLAIGIVPCASASAFPEYYVTMPGGE